MQYGLDDETTVREGTCPSQPPPCALRLTRVGVELCPDRTARLLSSEEPLVVGRKPGDGGFPVADVKLSRAHFRIAWDQRTRAFKLDDLQSQNGTFVDGRPIASGPLRAGAVIRAGDSLFVCHAPEDPERACRIERAAASRLNVFITGATGTGKERLAQELHDRSGRRTLVAVNCGAIPRDLVGSELFGHVRGAFSGATGARTGLFARADGGTLFLDEIGELPLEQQPALLRVLEDGRVRPVGGDSDVSIDVRVFAATNTDPVEAMERGRLRRDLYARLAGHTLELLPLRARREVILTITGEILRELGMSVVFGSDALEALLLWDYPFNVRELKTLLRALGELPEKAGLLRLDELRSVRPEIAARWLERRAEHDDSDGVPAPARAELVGLFERFGGNVSAVAKHLGRSRSSVYRWMRRVGLEPADERD